MEDEKHLLIMVISDFDKHSCVATAFKIVDDYIQKVIMTGKYKGDNPYNLGSSEQMTQTMFLLLCDFITKIERINNSNYCPLQLRELKDYIANIPDQNMRYTQISSFDFYESGIAQKLFEEFSNNIHTLMPFYKGVPIENIYTLTLFNSFS